MRGRWLACLGFLLASGTARAEGMSSFQAGLEALAQGRPKEAIALFESMADQGVVDAAASFNRGVAYVERARIAEKPGDLGQAAHGFEEARALPCKTEVHAAAERALATIHSEVARRRARNGQPAIIEQAPPMWQSVIFVAPENAWTALALLFSWATAAALFLRWRTSHHRTKVGATITLLLAVPLGGATIAMALTARHLRLHRREAVVVSAEVRPADERHISIAAEPTLPEGARVELLSDPGEWVKIRWGKLEAWVPGGSVRALAKIEPR